MVHRKQKAKRKVPKMNFEASVRVLLSFVRNLVFASLYLQNFSIILFFFLICRYIQGVIFISFTGYLKVWRYSCWFCLRNGLLFFQFGSFFPIYGIYKIPLFLMYLPFYHVLFTFMLTFNFFVVLPACLVNVDISHVTRQINMLTITLL